MVTDKDGNIVSMTMVPGKLCEQHKSGQIILGFCSRCPREKIKTVCPMDLVVWHCQLKDELDETEFEEVKK